MNISTLQINLILDQEIEKLWKRIERSGNNSDNHFNWLDGQRFALVEFKNKINNLKPGK